MRGTASRLSVLVASAVVLTGPALVWSPATAFDPVPPAQVTASVAPRPLIPTRSVVAEPQAVRWPRTGFEARRGRTWTTLAEEAAFLAKLDAMSAHVRVQVVGRTRLGRPIRLVIVGPSRTRAQIAAGSAALLVCTQHGDEPAPREACLQRARDLAMSRTARTVLFIPTANPDGVAANTRANSSGIDINRTHRTLRTREARAIAAVMSSYQPDVLNDLHEYRAKGDRFVRTRGDRCYGPRVPRAIRRLSIELTHRWQEATLRRGGYATAPYSQQVIPSTLAEVSAQKHIVGALTETPRLGTLTRWRRVDAQRRSIDGTLQMLAHRRAALAAATRRAGRYA
jgi:hypothetical protein